MSSPSIKVSSALPRVHVPTHHLRSSSSNISIIKGIFKLLRGDQPARLRYIRDEQRALGMSDLCGRHRTPNHESTQTRRNDQSRFWRPGDLANVVVVDELHLGVEPAWQGLEVDRRRGDDLLGNLLP